MRFLNDFLLPHALELLHQRGEQLLGSLDLGLEDEAAKQRACKCNYLLRLLFGLDALVHVAAKVCRLVLQQGWVGDAVLKEKSNDFGVKLWVCFDKSDRVDLLVLNWRLSKLAHVLFVHVVDESTEARGHSLLLLQALGLQFAYALVLGNVSAYFAYEFSF